MARIVSLIVPITALIFLTAISPLLLSVYFLYWTWAKIISRTCHSKNYEMMAGEDVMASMDDHKHNSIISAIVILKGTFTVEKLQNLFASRILDARDKRNEPLLPKFTQCFDEMWNYWFWRPKKNFDINEHIRNYEGSAIQTEEELKKFVNKIIHQTIPSSIPQWEIVVVPYLAEDEVKTVCAFRIHHAICDGVSFLRIIMSELAGNSSDMKTILEKAASKRQTKLKNNFRHKLTKIIQLTRVFVFSPMFVLRPFLMKERHMLHGRKLIGITICDWSANIKLETIKDIKDATLTTVNDVITSCLAGAVRRCFLRNKNQPPKFINVYIPVSLQGPNDALKNTNKLSFAIAKLPTGDMDCLERLREAKLIMDEIKTSPQIMINLIPFKLLGSVFPNVIIKMIRSYSPCGIIFSNVPGPSTSIYWAGHEMVQLFPIAQIRSESGVGITIFSYGGIVNLSVTMDSALISDPTDVSMLLKDIEDEVNHLYNFVVKR